jgi:DNA processing protein
MVTTISGIISKHNILVLTREESRCPQGLLQIDAPPPVLYVRGEILPRDRLSLVVVGSRKMTRYGREVVEALVPELAAAGLTIVSGLALGIDTVAHRVALEAEGRTIAVLPCGMDQVYPLSNTSLAEQIIGSNRGALITEFPPGNAGL